MKYSDRGATVDVYIEIITKETSFTSPAMTTPLTPPDRKQAIGEVVSAVKSPNDGVESYGIPEHSSFKGKQEPLHNKGGTTSLAINANALMDSNKSTGSPNAGSVGRSLVMYADVKTTSKEMSTLFGSSDRSDSDRLKRPMENGARLPLSDDPLRPMRTTAMVVVHVVDSGFGLSGII